RASSKASASPMPDDAPVMRTVLSFQNGGTVCVDDDAFMFGTSQMISRQRDAGPRSAHVLLHRPRTLYFRRQGRHTCSGPEQCKVFRATMTNYFATTYWIRHRPTGHDHSISAELSTRR